MTMTPYDIHFSMLFLPTKQALSVIIELSTPFCNIPRQPLTIFICRAIKHFLRVKLALKITNSQIDIFVKKIGLNFICERVSVGEE